VHQTEAFDSFIERLTIERGVSVNQYDRKALLRFDEVRLAFSWVNHGRAEQYAPSMVLFTERGFDSRQGLSPKQSWGSPDVSPGYTGRQVISALVPIGTKAIICEIDRRAPIRIDLGTGVTTTLEGTRLSSAARVDLSAAKWSINYRRIPVNARLEGVSMVQSGCVRFFDLGVDDVYVTRTAREEGDGPVDTVLLDAMFLKRAMEPSTSPDCHRHVSLTAQYVRLGQDNGRTQGGAEAGASGGSPRQTRRFAVRPDTNPLRFVFGDPRSPDAILEVDVERGTAKVVQRAPALSLSATSDFSDDWLQLKARDPALYGAQKIYRHRWQNRGAPSRDEMISAACKSFSHLKTTFASLDYEAEPDFEFQKLACPPVH